MKTKEQLVPKDFDPNQEAELTLYPTWNGNKPFVINGIGHVVLDVLEDSGASKLPEQVHVPVKAVKPATQPENVPRDVLTGRRATIHAKLYDFVNGSSMYGLLKQKRRDEQDLAMATRLGLISLEDVSCQKHRKAISKLHGMVE